jgi:hypothetical protein
MQDDAAQTTPLARLWHGAVALIIAAALVTQLVLSATAA